MQQSSASSQPGRFGLALNEDNSHFFTSRSADAMTREGVRELVDHYAVGKVDSILWCPNGMRTSYRSDVWDFIASPENIHAANQCASLTPDAKAWITNARLLDERGIDPYTIWFEACREKNISPWISMRMNDVHCALDSDSFMHSTFWRDHPDYRRNPQGREYWPDQALDYGLPAVRDHAMALIEEFFERYDMAGLELDWMRFGYHFKPGHEREGCEILTAFMARVRTLANTWASRRGHPIELGVRVPTRPENARGLGMDAVRWAREKFIDRLVLSPFWSTSDFDIPVEQWVELLGPANDAVTLAVGFERGVRGDPAFPKMPCDAELARGFAVSTYHRGADQVYLFNFMHSTFAGSDEDYQAILGQTGDLNTALLGPRRHVVTFVDTVAPGAPACQSLPVSLETNGFTPCIRIHIGPRPDKTMATAVLRLGLGNHPNTHAAHLSAWINTIACEPIEDHLTPTALTGCTRLLQFNIPRAALQEGYNVIHMSLDSPGPHTIHWAEIRIA